MASALLEQPGDMDSPAEERFVAHFKAEKASKVSAAMFALTNSARRSHNYVTAGKRDRDIEIERIVQNRRIDELRALGAL